MNDKKLKKEIQKCKKEIEEIIDNVNMYDLREINDSVTKVYGIYQKFPSSKDLAVQYMTILDCLAQRQAEWVSPTSGFKELEVLAALQETDLKAYGIYLKQPNLEELPFEYIIELRILATEVKEIDALQETVSKASVVYKKFPNSKDLAVQYMTILDCLAQRQAEWVSIASILKVRDYIEVSKDTTRGLQETVCKASVVYKKFPNSKDLAFPYMSILGKLLSVQKDFGEVQNTITRIKDVHNHVDKDKIFNWHYATLVFDYIINSLIDLPEGEKDQFIVNLEVVFDWVSDESAKLIENIIDKLFYTTNSLIKLTDHNAKIMSKLLCGFSKIVSLQKTKYAVLINFLRELEDKDCQLEPLIIIYCLVQTIKFQLSMKDLSKEDFGHYTSGEVLQILLKQSSDNQKPYSIKGRTRLGNVKYMNDPEEGSVLDKYLELGNSNSLEDSLKPSPWFFMSLTTAIDDLAMWSQYGARAEGVCLVFKADSFEVVNSMVETEWIVNKIDSPIWEEKLEDIKNKEKDSSSKKDFLYRICYLDEKSLKQGNLYVVKKENNKMLEETEIDTINNCLDKIKSILSKIEKNTILYSVLDDCLEEIRYLFKVSDYSYESELRILRYADLNPDNNKIKIDNSGPIAKLYLERDLPIQLKQVIFGPKFSNPEHVTPLLHLLDKDIEFKRSERKFK